MRRLNTWFLTLHINKKNKKLPAANKQPKMKPNNCAQLSTNGKNPVRNKMQVIPKWYAITLLGCIK